MSERPDEFRHLCALYALGSLDEAEAARFEAHLRTGCSACQAGFGDGAGPRLRRPPSAGSHA